MRRLAVILALFLVACNDRGCKCHMGHEEVNYHAAHSTETCLQRDEKSGWCSNEITTYHPAHCSISFVCDMTCKAADTGAREAHPDHPVRNLGRTNMSPFECFDNGSLR